MFRIDLRKGAGQRFAGASGPLTRGVQRLGEHGSVPAERRDEFAIRCIDSAAEHRTQIFRSQEFSVSHAETSWAARPLAAVVLRERRGLVMDCRLPGESPQPSERKPTRTTTDNPERAGAGSDGAHVAERASAKAPVEDNLEEYRRAKLRRTGHMIESMDETAHSSILDWRRRVPTSLSPFEGEPDCSGCPASCL